MMTFTQIAGQIKKTRRVTPTLEKEIDSVLWSKKFDAVEMALLEELAEAIAKGTVAIG